MSVAPLFNSYVWFISWLFNLNLQVIFLKKSIWIVYLPSFYSQCIMTAKILDSQTKEVQIQILTPSFPMILSKFNNFALHIFQISHWASVRLVELMLT